jgi:hypothetical protein
MNITNLARSTSDELRLLAMAVKSFDDSGAMRIVPGKPTKGDGERFFRLLRFGFSRTDVREIFTNDFR